MRLILLLGAALLNLNAATVEARYAISFWVFGRIGTATLTLQSDDKRYRIEANATLEGMAALLAHHHRETFESRGRVDKEGRFIPERYRVLRTLDTYSRERIYRFTRHGIFRTQTETFTDTKRTFDTSKMRMVTTEQPASVRRVRIEPYKADDDLLTLYFNARSAMAAMKPDESLILRSAGAGNGKVTIQRETPPHRYLLQLDQDIFRSAKGEMEIETDDELYVKKAVLKDVLLFGDLEVEREWLKQSR